jgi:hypothetical protein
VLKAAEMPLVEASSGRTRFDTLFAQFYPELAGSGYRVPGDRMETEDTLWRRF